MDRIEAHTVAQGELGNIEEAGYATASEHVGTIALKNISAASGKIYEIELSYHWKDKEQVSILIICRVTSRKWFEHQRLDESVTLCEDAI